uniref:Inner membrane protein n=1 Tax=Angiostrongylus cantonensis TaxID=6313 RepID=A0A0K0CVL8_ANGCA
MTAFASVKDFTVIALVASAISFVVYNLLYLIAQLWEAFATLFLGLYYVALFYGFMKARKSFLIVGTGLLALTTVVLVGLFVFFIVEIFHSHSLVYQFLIYIKHMDEKQRVVGRSSLYVTFACGRRAIGVYTCEH